MTVAIPTDPLNIATWDAARAQHLNQPITTLEINVTIPEEYIQLYADSKDAAEVLGQYIGTCLHQMLNKQNQGEG